MPLPKGHCSPDGIKIHPIDGTIYFGTYGSVGESVFVSDPDNISWENISFSGSRILIDMCLDTNNALYTFTVSGGAHLHKYENNEWTHLYFANYPYFMHTPLECSPFNNTLYTAKYIQSDRFVGLLSQDGGDTWIESDPVPNKDKTIAAYAFKSADTVYVGVNHFIPIDGGVYRSVDGGLSWEAEPIGLPGSMAIKDMCVSDNGKLLVAQKYWNPLDSIMTYPGDGIYKQGNSDTAAWRRVYEYPTFEIVKDKKGCLYAAAAVRSDTVHAGVIQSCDNGETWHTIFNTDIVYLEGVNLKLSISKDGALYLGFIGYSHPNTNTHYDSHLYRTQLFEGIEDIPNTKAVAKVYPNPFTQSATVYYNLQHTARMRYVLYNYLGQEVKAAVLGTQLQGQHTFQVDDIPAGIYVLQLWADNKPMATLKIQAEN